VWKAPVNAGGSATKVTRDGGFAPVESSDGKFVYYLKGIESRSIWRVRVEGGEETFVVDRANAELLGLLGASSRRHLLRDVGTEKCRCAGVLFDFASKSKGLVGQLDAHPFSSPQGSR